MITLCNNLEKQRGQYWCVPAVVNALLLQRYGFPLDQVDLVWEFIQKPNHGLRHLKTHATVAVADKQDLLNHADDCEIHNANYSGFAEIAEKMLGNKTGDLLKPDQRSTDSEFRRRVEELVNGDKPVAVSCYQHDPHNPKVLLSHMQLVYEITTQGWRAWDPGPSSPNKLLSHTTLFHRDFLYPIA
jgi:hypothetical protein